MLRQLEQKAIIQVEHGALYDERDRVDALRQKRRAQFKIRVCQMDKYAHGEH